MAVEFSEFILNHPQFKLLREEKKNSRLTHAYILESADKLFVDNFSLLFASMIFCNQEGAPCMSCVECQKVGLESHADLCILPKEKSIVVDDVKMLIENSVLKPLESDCKVFIFKDFSNATVQAQNKLLKILETPPENVYIILNVENINAVLPTIISRCKKIRLEKFDNETIKEIVRKNNPKVDVNVIAEASGGSLQRALNFAQDAEFNDCYELAIFTLENLKSSATLLSVSSKIVEKKNYFDNYLEILISMLRDILLIRLRRENYVENKQLLERLKTLSLEFNADCVDLIIKKIYAIKKQLEFNCNPTVCIDNLLLYILEVKYLCNKQ